MRVAITGDRNWTSRKAIESALGTLNPETDFLILGDARGADAMALSTARELGIPHEVHEADWDSFHRAAGHIRNRAMLDAGPDEVWYFHDCLMDSKGTKNCVEQAMKRGITVRNGRLVSGGV